MAGSLSIKQFDLLISQLKKDEKRDVEGHLDNAKHRYAKIENDLCVYENGSWARVTQPSSRDTTPTPRPPTPRTDSRAYTPTVRQFQVGEWIVERDTFDLIGRKTFTLVLNDFKFAKDIGEVRQEGAHRFVQDIEGRSAEWQYISRGKVLEVKIDGTYRQLAKMA